jgi:hypothetical protein
MKRKAKKKVRRKATKRPVLYVRPYEGACGWNWEAGPRGGAPVFLRLCYKGTKEAALADARRVLGRYCAGCDVRYPK